MEEESADLPANQEKRKRKRRKKKKGVEEGGSAVKSSTEEPSDGSTGAPEERTDASSITGVPSGTKNLEDTQVNGAGEHGPQTPGKKRNLKRDAAEADVSSGGTLKDAPTAAANVQEEPPQEEEEENLSVTAEKRRRRRRKKQLPATTTDAGGSSEGASQVKRKKIPVVFEFEADELQTFSNGDAEDEAANAVSPKSRRIKCRIGR